MRQSLSSAIYNLNIKQMLDDVLEYKGGREVLFFQLDCSVIDKNCTYIRCIVLCLDTYTQQNDGHNWSNEHRPSTHIVILFMHLLGCIYGLIYVFLYFAVVRQVSIYCLTDFTHSSISNNHHHIKSPEFTPLYLKFYTL